MLTENLAILFERDLLKVKSEITAYTGESTLWMTAAQVSNSGGNLCLHLIGNLNHYIGGVLGSSGYTRNRPLEFSQKNIPSAELVSTIDQTIDLVTKTLRTMTQANLDMLYPEKVFDKEMSTEFFLLHLLAHLNYHLGQINYHRRILDGYQPEAGG